MRILALGQFNLSRNFLELLVEHGHTVAYGYVGKPALPRAESGVAMFPIQQATRIEDIRAAVDQHDPDLLFVGSAGYDGSNALAYDLLEARGVPPIIRFYKEYLIKASRREFEVLTRSNGVVLHAPAALGYFNAIYGLPQDRVHVYDHDMVADHLVPEDLPERLSTRDGEPHVVIAGTLKSDGSGYDYRDLIVGLSERGVHVHVFAVAHSKWLAVGRALDPDSAEVREAYAPLLERPYVHFEEPVPQSEHIATLASYDVGIMQVAARSYVPELTPWQQMDHPSKYSYYLAAALPLAIQCGTLASLRSHVGPELAVDYSDAGQLAASVADRALMGTHWRAAAEARGAFRLGYGLPALLTFAARLAGARI